MQDKRANRARVTMLLILAITLATTVYSLWRYQGSTSYENAKSMSTAGGFGRGFMGEGGGWAFGNDRYGGDNGTGTGRSGSGTSPGSGTPVQPNDGAGNDTPDRTSTREGLPGQGRGTGETRGEGAGTGSAAGTDSSDRSFGQGQAGGGRGNGFADGGMGMGGRGFSGTSASEWLKTPLLLYVAGFAAIVVAAGIWLKKRKLSLSAENRTSSMNPENRTCSLNLENRKLLLATLLGGGFLLRMAIAPWVGAHNDLSLFRNWALTAAQGLADFYQNGNADYPPVYIYILYPIGKAIASLGVGGYSVLLLKLPALLADTATAWLLYRIARKRLPEVAGLLIAAFYLLNPAVLLNSTFWGQVDSFFTLLILLALSAIAYRRPTLSAVLFTIAILMKPQGIIFLPVLFFELVRGRRLMQWVKAAGAALGTAILLLLPFSIGKDPLWIIDLYKSTVGEYPYASVNAFNFFGLIGTNYTPSEQVGFLISYHLWGLVFIAVTTLFSWVIYHRAKSPDAAYLAGLIQIVGVFTFSTSMHERYLYPAIALALAAFAMRRDERQLGFAAAFTATVYANTHAIYFSRSAGMNGASTSFVLLAVSLLNVILCFLLAKISWEGTSRDKDLPGSGGWSEGKAADASRPVPGRPADSALATPPEFAALPASE
ncbi:glycosyltransferase 87 family protein [Gorillibacterium sp. CAU 1737]|uniref:glycosyltransferase 87 family protein n=1 Tax=Gorillibacterium sp. CAU 1737 TaxID=3140362 RepID=UPI0032617DDC